MPVEKCTTKYSYKKRNYAVYSSNEFKITQHYCKDSEYQVDHFHPRYYDDYSNRSIKLFRQISTQLQIKILAKKLGVKNLSTRLDKWQIMVFQLPNCTFALPVLKTLYALMYLLGLHMDSKSKCYYCIFLTHGITDGLSVLENSVYCTELR